MPIILDSKTQLVQQHAVATARHVDLSYTGTLVHESSLPPSMLQSLLLTLLFFVAASPAP